jgi:23S rRNA U2552 (ribose-2'-O)-methylase RlmE/FtsJ
MLIYDIKTGAYDYDIIVPDIWDRLNLAKAGLDTPFMNNPANARIILNMLDPFEDCKRKLLTHIPYKVSRAWMKCHELDTQFALIKSGTYVWDNCAFPGMFIAAHNHIHAALYNKPIKWVASSLFGSAESLPDTYGLYSNYRSQWLMNKDNDGNVCFSKNLLDFQHQIGQTISLYTSDLGMDSSNSYNDQEAQHVDAHYGQAVAGLITLAIGGDFVAKHFTFAHPQTVQLIHTLARLFTEFYICKPVTSALANSEVYFVGKGFLGISSEESAALLDKVVAPNYKIGGSGTESVVANNIQFAATDIYTRQIKALGLYTRILSEYGTLDLHIPGNKKIIKTAIGHAYYHAMGQLQDDTVRDWMAQQRIGRINPQCEIVKAPRQNLRPRHNA